MLIYILKIHVTKFINERFMLKVKTFVFENCKFIWLKVYLFICVLKTNFIGTKGFYRNMREEEERKVRKTLNWICETLNPYWVKLLGFTSYNVFI